MTEPLLDLDPGLNFCPDRVGSIHILGICGTAMAALAGMLKESGYAVSGSDANVYPPMSDFLKQIDVTVFSGYKPENLHPPADLVIVGNVISKPNPEAQELARLRLPYLSMPQAIGNFYISGKRSLVVTGTHGKTTTSSMLAAALFSAGGDPGFMIGGILHQFESNYRIAKGACFVTEGDEYDTAFFDKESKFFHYRPDIAIITSLEFDHADIFDDLEQIKRSFKKFVGLLPQTGLIIAHTEDANVAEVVDGAPCPVESYGLTEHSDWRIFDPQFSPGRSTFEISYRSKPYSTLSIGQSGYYNCLNSTAVAAVLHHLGYEKQIIADGLGGFKGVKRRQEIRGEVNNITIIDDFAHHPTAVGETLKGLKKAYPSHRLIAVFEPRTNTSRRSIFQQKYVASFADADLSIIREVGSDKPVDGDDRFSSVRLAEDLRKRGLSAWAFADTDQIIAHISGIAQPGDIIAVLSNGGFDNIHERLLETLKKSA
ncbi:UDP-N-acetylmuramate:L-alanyl-gamma-D-glutamyl-meso-diaminopimelate ligase [Thermodesulfobacteriota bacterium]